MIGKRIALRVGASALGLILAGCNAASATPLASTTVAARTSGPSGPVTGAQAVPAALPTPTPPPVDLSAVPSRVHVDKASGTSGVVGPEGGTLQASSSDGTSYRLDIPPLAVEGATPISMTPISTVDSLGLSGGLAGAVYLAPSGLHLAEPATLTITTAKPAPAGTRLVGFDVAGEGTMTNLLPATGQGSTVTVVVFHFSAPGAGYGTTQDLQQLVQPGGGQLSSALTTFYAEPVPWDPSTIALAFAGINTAWADVIQPELTTVTGDQALLAALADWRQFVFLMNLDAHKGDVAAALADGSLALAQPAPSFEVVFFTAGLALVDKQIAAAIDGNQSVCRTSHDLHALANVIFWQALATKYDPAVVAVGPSSNGCATIDFGLFNPASNLTAGGADSLQVSLVLVFSDGTQAPADFDLNLHGTGFTFAITGGPDATAGEAASAVLTLGVQATAGPPYQFSVSGCWILDGLARNFCSGQLGKSFGSPASPSPAASAQSAVTPPPVGAAIVIDTDEHLPITGPCQPFEVEFGVGHTGSNGYQFTHASQATITVSGAGHITSDSGATALVQAGAEPGDIEISATGWYIDPHTTISAHTSVTVDELIGVYVDHATNVHAVVDSSPTSGEYILILPDGTAIQMPASGSGFTSTGPGKDINVMIDAVGMHGTINGTTVNLPRQTC